MNSNTFFYIWAGVVSEKDFAPEKEDPIAVTAGAADTLPAFCNEVKLFNSVHPKMVSSQ